MMTTCNKIGGRLSLLVLTLIIFTGCKEQILHNLSEGDANRLLTKLSEIELQAEKVRQPDGTWAIAVEEDAALTAIRYLETTRTLRDLGETSLPESSIVSSREDQRFRFERALAREIEGTISSIDGVLEARVHLSLPPVDPLFGQPIGEGRGSASVLVVTRPEHSGGVQNTTEGDEASRGSVRREEIANLVSGASGIPPQRISVVHSVTSEVAVAPRQEMVTDVPPSHIDDSVGGVVDAAPMSRVTHGVAPSWYQGEGLVALGAIALGILGLIAGIGIVLWRRYSRREADRLNRKFQQMAAAS